MNTKLKNITNISSGQTFRKKVESDVNGQVWVIQMKDLNKSYTSIAQTPVSVNEQDISQSQLLENGDILFLAKGNNNKAFVFQESHPAVAVSLFFIFKTDRGKLLPEYLAWFLNQKDTQNLLKSTREGSTVSSIKKVTLENLLIPLPSIEEQEYIAKIYSLHTKEEQLGLKLAEKRNNLIDTLLINRANESTSKF